MKQIFILIIVFFTNLVSNAQTNNYAYTLDWVIETFSNNDAGFQVTIDQKGEDDYQRFTSGIKEKINKVDNDDDCVKVIRSWLSYFRKGHVEFGLKNKSVYLENEKQHDKSESIPDSIFANRLSDNTFYLRIPSFSFTEKDAIERLLEENDKQISASKNLVIDIRNGTGGSDASFWNLLKYLYTNPICSYGIELKASDLNAEGFDNYADKMNDAHLRVIAQRLRDNKGNFVSPSGDDKEITTIELKEVLKSPQYVAIIINEKNLSSDEQFLLYAKQSLKTKLFGRPTAGAIDISNVTFVLSPDDKYYLSYSMSRSGRAKYMTLDGIGIQPDFLIGDDVPKDKWVEYVQNVLECN